MFSDKQRHFTAWQYISACQTLLDCVARDIALDVQTLVTDTEAEAVSFRDNTLGPRTRIEDDPLGGAFLLTFSSEVFFPVPFLDDSSGMRLGAFVDVGNVFEDYNAFDAGDLRYSVGLSGLWVSPLGPLSVSIAVPLNDEDEDDVQNFQFSVGSFF